MKKATLLLFALILSSAVTAFGQIDNPVTWSYAAKKVSKTEAVVYLKATIQDGWHIYSLNQKAGGPIKTTVSFDPSKDYSKVGLTTEPKPTVKHEDAFNMNVSYFEKQVIFQQKIRIPKGSAAVKGKVEFMVCNDRKCLPPDEVVFSVQVK
jgi:DsbC/DsbD-like thiol-disulfide interchange protein